MNNFPRWYFWVILVWLFVADQFTKMLVLKNLPLNESRVIVRNFLYLTHVTNDGVAWGMLRGHGTLIGVIIVIGLALALLWYAPRLNWRSSEVSIVAAVILAGAFGNLTDRFRLGQVIDFIDVIVPVVNYRWPAFNIADASISLCVVWLLYRTIFPRRPNGANGKYVLH